MQAALIAESYLICLAVNGLLLYWTARAETLSTSDRWLRGFLASFQVLLAARMLLALTVEGLIPGGAAVAWTLKTVSCLALCAVVFCWCGYAEMKQKSSPFRRKTGRRTFGLLLVIPALLALLNLAGGWLFRFDETLGCSHGPLYHVLMLCLLAGMAVCAVRLARLVRREMDPLRKRHLLLLPACIPCLLAAWLWRENGTAVRWVCACTTLWALCLYRGNESQQISMDKLTQVNNRQNLMGFLRYKLQNHEDTLLLLMIDVDGFKHINDSFGHLKGDEALVLVARAMKLACVPERRRPYIARYGGDEFIVVMEGSEEDAAALSERIRSRLRELTPESCPFRLQLSIGIGRCEAGMDAQALIHAADMNMYGDKRSGR